MSVAIADHVRDGFWRVWCINCWKEIGTMDGDTLAAAMLWAAGRGGVKCPECRAVSCKTCGLQMTTGDIIANGNQCYYCQEEAVIEGGALV